MIQASLTMRRHWFVLIGCLLMVSLLIGCAKDSGSTAPVGSEATVSLAVYCQRASEADLAGIPADGVLLAPQDLAWIEGETVAELLERAARAEALAVSSQGSGSLRFIASIGGLAAVDGRSGWMFCVNDEFVMTGSGTLKVNPGDRIEWHYTMDSGFDLK